MEVLRDVDVLKVVAADHERQGHCDSDPGRNAALTILHVVHAGDDLPKNRTLFSNKQNRKMVAVLSLKVLSNKDTFAAQISWSSRSNGTDRGTRRPSQAAVQLSTLALDPSESDLVFETACPGGTHSVERPPHEQSVTFRH